MMWSIWSEEAGELTAAAGNINYEFGTNLIIVPLFIERKQSINMSCRVAWTSLGIELGAVTNIPYL